MHRKPELQSPSAEHRCASIALVSVSETKEQAPQKMSAIRIRTLVMDVPAQREFAAAA
jgi:hypothetical protein